MPLEYHLGLRPTAALQVPLKASLSAAALAACHGSAMLLMDRSPVQEDQTHLAVLHRFQACGAGVHMVGQAEQSCSWEHSHHSLRRSGSAMAGEAHGWPQLNEAETLARTCLRQICLVQETLAVSALGG